MLVVSHHPDGGRLAEALTRDGRKVFLVDSASEAERASGLAELLAEGRGARQIVLLAHSVGDEGDQERDPSRAAYDELLALARAVAPRGAGQPLEIVVVTAAAHEVTGDERLVPGLATVLGPCLVIPQEHPWIRCRNLDLAAPGPLDDDGLGWLAGEIASAAPEPVVARRGAHRWVLGAVPSPLSGAPDEPAASLLRPGATYAIVGRLHGGLGALLAGYLRERVGARVVVIGPDVAKAGAGDQASHPEADALAALQPAGSVGGEGTGVASFAAELDDAAAMGAAFRAAEEQAGRIAGVFHASWMGRAELACPVSQVGGRHTALLFRERVAGLPVLEAVLRGREPDFCMVQSSLSAVIGGVGFAAYAAANAFADAFVAAASRRASYPWLSVDWEARAQELAETGVVRTRLGAEIAELALTDEDIARVLDRLLVTGRSGQVIVSPGELALRAARARPQDPRAAPHEGAPQADRPVSRLGDLAAGSPAARAVGERGDSLGAYVAPADEAERAIAEIWEEFVTARPVGVRDDYFALGGTSLAAVQILARLKARFGVEVPLEAILGAAPTVAHVAQVVRGLTAADDDAELSTLVAMVEALPPDEARRLLEEQGGARAEPNLSTQRQPADTRDAGAKG